ncbi:MAG: T9SS type A sorting domain-containing protein [Candidatus Stahlbacteria bacterium]|nr:T9SS type A sorting domain-containing protein [Candidatus Stahlbacteria bacterium]
MMPIIKKKRMCSYSATTQSFHSFSNSRIWIFIFIVIFLPTIIFSFGGDIPVRWPNHFIIGLVNTRTEVGWMDSSGVPWDARYCYLCGGFTGGWAQWLPNGDYARLYMEESRNSGYIPAFTYYQIPGDEGESYSLDSTHINDSTYMCQYFQDYKLLLDLIAVFDSTVIIVLEPDFWGYMQQHAREHGDTTDNPSSVFAYVDSTGLPYCQGFENSLAGIGRCLINMTRTFAPKALVGLHANLWSAAMGTDSGLVYSPDSVVIKAAEKTGIYLKRCGADSGDIVIVEKNGLDAGGWWAIYSVHCFYWGDEEMRHYVLWVNKLTDIIGKRACGWQIPIGHIELPNVDSLYEDTFAEYFFAHMVDSFPYHIKDFYNAGCIGILYGGGTVLSTNYRVDGGWFRERAYEYYTYGPYMFQPSVEEKPVSKVRSIELEIRPNPFIKSTIISYQIQDRSIMLGAKCLIYNLSGRLMRVFPISQPVNSITWDGKDSQGRDLPNGMYFCRLQIKDFNQTTKVILIK